MKKETRERPPEAPDESKAKKKRCRKRLRCLFFGMLLVGLLCLFLTEHFKKDRYAGDRFEEMEKIETELEKTWAEREETEAEREEGSASSPKSTDSRKTKKDRKSRPKKEKKELQNPDWIGWLKIRGTTISYPVMERTGDSEYYLHRDFDGNYSFWGTPFLDIRCNPDSDNCIIYGHNINGGRMFGALHKYAGQDYYMEHPDIKVRFGEEKRNYEIISVIQTTTASELYSFTDTGNWKEYQNYVKQILNGSLYHTKAGEKIRKEMERCSLEDFFRKYQFVSLSTCRSWVGKNARLLVIGAAERQEMRGDNENE